MSQPNNTNKSTDVFQNKKNSIIKTEMQDKYKLGVETDPTGFSYFLSSNMPLPDKCRLELLKARDTVSRLRYSSLQCFTTFV
jgi:hypothetical protein